MLSRILVETSAGLSIVAIGMAVPLMTATPPSKSCARDKTRPETADHWHRTEDDKGRPYKFVDAETLVTDFFREAYRVLGERGISIEVVRETEKRRKT